MRKILFIGMHRLDRSPSQRYRFEQYFDFLEKNGFECELSSLISVKDDAILYSHGHYFGKAIIFFKSFFKRLIDVWRSKKYDLIFIQREAFMTGTIFFERLFKKTGTPIIFDFDDAIWLRDENLANRSLQFLKRPEKTAQIIALADHVIAGNNYLADFALKYNEQVSVIPTTVDTELYNNNYKGPEATVCIGWTGSFTTIKHFELAVPILLKIKAKYGHKVRFKLIGDAHYHNQELDLKGIPWQSKSEVQDLSDIDIGIMPLPDDKWSKGKCGLKGLQYMALGIPTIMSAVGVNTEIIDSGHNGLLASTPAEWEKHLSDLIESRELRESLGEAGRKTVEKYYSIKSNQEKYLEVFNNILRS